MITSQFYARPEDMELLKNEPYYVINRYFTIIKTIVDALFRWTRQQAADHLGISKRHMKRLVRTYLMKGIPGLRLKSKRPKKTPTKSPLWIEHAVTTMKKLTGFGNDSISDLVNEQFRLEGCDQRITPSLAYSVVKQDICHPVHSNTLDDDSRGVTFGARHDYFPILRQT
jgi:hypothetical protein